MPFKKIDAEKELNEFVEESGMTREEIEENIKQEQSSKQFDAKAHFKELEEYGKTHNDCYLIPISYSVCGHLEIPKSKVSSLKEAIEMAKEDDSIPLPTEIEYIDGSFEVNEDKCLIEFMNPGEKIE